MYILLPYDVFKGRVFLVCETFFIYIQNKYLLKC